MTLTLTPTLKRIINERGRLLLDEPFFGMLALRLRLQEDSSADTAWTDGQTMAFNPAFVATLTDEQLRGLIIHEVMHCACGHPWRRDARDHKQFNIAADHAINHVIVAAGHTLPDGALIDPAFEGKNAEWIYARLPQPTPDDDGQQGSGSGSGQDGQQQAQQATGQQPGQQQAQGQAGQQNAPQGSQQPQQAPAAGQAGEVRDAPAAAADADDVPTQEDWQQAVRQATAAAAARGSVAGSTVEALKAAAHTAIDWRALLQRYLTDITASDYSWTRPSSRYIASGLYLPALRSQECGALVVALDTSGSVDTVLLEQFIAELNAIAAVVKPVTVHVMQCDTRVRHVDCFDRGESIDVPEIFGRGGTSFDPIFDAVDAAGIDPVALLYFTDMDGSFPTSAPAYPVLWCAYGRGINATAPFGEVIPCE